ncbi:hypothetical protein [Streptomyces sp. WAC06614]|uniref:hypothetical protein n=1 Tax=Streptomyces sp. WAC06614 TaxID=2487416 RepID=UPI000F779991|nr:hypothetical protein [Streptomyces sp. WAC06614]RSS66670.1 hypothetical protein EF918_29475 [Streptomyces sp. WAC06614]
MDVRSVVLRPGQSYALRLTGRGARGCVWTWRISGDPDAVEVTEAPGPAEDAAATTLPGADVELVYVVRGRRPGGRARIRFAQVRPPYPHEPPYDTCVLDVEVRPAPPGGP